MGTITCENSVDYAEREAKGMAGCKLLLNRGLVFDWIGCSNLQIRVPRGCAPSGCNCMHRSSDETFLLSSHSGHLDHPRDAAILQGVDTLGERASQLHAAPELSPMSALCVEHIGSPLERFQRLGQHLSVLVKRSKVRNSSSPK
jgi:hypothetical protein